MIKSLYILNKPAVLLAVILSCFCTANAQNNQKLEADSIICYNYLNEAEVFSSNGNQDSAIFYYDLAEKAIQEKNLDKSFLAKVYSSKGHHYHRLSLYSEAIAAINRSIEIYKEIGLNSKVAKSYNILGTFHKRQLRNQDALFAFNKAAEIYAVEKDSLGIASVDINVGNVLKQIGQTELAKKKYLEAIKIYTIKKQNDGIASAYNNLGNIFKNDGDYDSAFFYMYKTLQLRLQEGSKKGLAYIYNNLGSLHKAINHNDSALYYYEKSIVLKEEIGDQVDLCQVYWSLSEVYFEEKSWAKSLQYLQMAEALINPESPLELQKDVFRSLGNLYHQTGNFKASSHYYIKCNSAIDSLNAQSNNQDIMFELGRYESLSDSLAKDKIRLSTELEKVKLENKNLQVDNEKRKFYYLFIVLGVILLMGILLLISFRRRLNQSSEHQTVLSAQNEELKRTLISKDEKEVLLKEIHHRVKNNLQIINSLIRLQSNFINQSNYNEKLKDTENRIRSMALIHEKLYQSHNLAKLDIRNYIEELCFTIMETYESDIKVKFKFEIQEREFGIDSLIPLGLIINEILSNSIKYAFEGRDEGFVEIILNFDEHSTYLRIKDNGMGADLSWDELKEDSLGLDLVESLTDQLDGEMTLDTQNGFDFNFTFPLLS